MRLINASMVRTVAASLAMSVIATGALAAGTARGASAATQDSKVAVFYPGIHSPTKVAVFYPGIHAPTNVAVFYPGIHAPTQVAVFYPGIHSPSRDRIG